jgi:hypothetical protein
VKYRLALILLVIAAFGIASCLAASLKPRMIDDMNLL